MYVTAIKWIFVFPIVYLSYFICSAILFISFGAIGKALNLGDSSVYPAIGFFVGLFVVCLSYYLAPNYKFIAVVITFIFGVLEVKSVATQIPGLISVNSSSIVLWSVVGGLAGALYCVVFHYLNTIRNSYYFKYVVHKFRL